MTKIIIITLILCSMVISCGKKGDPVYKDSKEIINMQTIKENKV